MIKLPFLAWVLVSLALWLPKDASAAAVQLNIKGFSVPISDNGQAVQDVNLYGVAVSTWNGVTITTPTLGAENVTKVWTTEPGILYDVELASGTATTEYVFCVDNDNASGVPLLTSGPTAPQHITLMTCHRSATVSKGCYESGGYRPVPRYFRLGLACYSDVDRPYTPLFRELR